MPPRQRGKSSLLGLNVGLPTGFSSTEADVVGVVFVGAGAAVGTFAS